MTIRTETINGVARIEIARPEKKNALTVAMYQAMADDDADMRMILEVALGTLGGWRVSLFADGEEAIAAARTGSARS